MQRWSIVLAVGTWTVLGLAGHFADAAGATAEPLSITPEPLTSEPGKPFSVRSLVQHPTPLADALSWTVESKRHRGSMLAMAISPDRKLLATAGMDGMIRIWDTASGELTKMLVGHDHYIYDLSWSPDGSTLASAGGWDYTVRVWNVEKSMPLRVFKQPKGYVRTVTWSDNGQRLLAAGGHSGYVWVWEPRTDMHSVVVELGQDIYSVDWAPDGEKFVASLYQGAVSTYEISSGKSVSSYGDPAPPKVMARFSPDGKKLFIGSAGGGEIYDVDEEKLIRKLALPGYGAAWSPDGTMIATATAGNIVSIWMVDTGKQIKTFAAAGYDLLWPEPDMLLVRGTGDLSGWKATEQERTFNYSLGGIGAPVWNAGRSIVAGVGTNTLSLWDNLTGKAGKKLEGHEAPITSVAWTRDGKTLASSSYDKTVRLWDAKSGEAIAVMKDHDANVMSVSWSVDGKTLASAGYDKNVRLWSNKGEPLGVLSGHTDGVMRVLWAPRGYLLASGGNDSTAKLWNVDKQTIMHDMPSVRPVLALAFTPDGSILAGGTQDDAIQLWDNNTGKSLNANMRVQGGPPSVTALAWSFDGSFLFAGRGNHTAQLWDVRQQKTVHNFVAMAPVDWVSWAAGGAMMVGGCQDRTVRFWDTPTAELRGTIVDLGEEVLILSADGHYKQPDLSKDAKDPSIVYVVQTADRQVMYKPDDFAAKYKWKNASAAVKFNR